MNASSKKKRQIKWPMAIRKWSDAPNLNLNTFSVLRKKTNTLFQIILYPHFLLLRLRKALHKSLPAGAEASVPMPETRNKRTRIRLILTAHTTICARNILFLHDFYSFFMISTLSESIFLLANPPELLSPGRSGNAQTSDNAPTLRFPTSPSRQMQEGVRHKPWR